VPYLNENLAVTGTREMPGGNATTSHLWYLVSA